MLFTAYCHIVYSLVEASIMDISFILFNSALSKGKLAWMHEEMREFSS